jgi:cellulose synthase/poly-beta-1,6-N-acetylglucosamine synthase-like glycosyltransferase
MFDDPFDAGIASFLLPSTGPVSSIRPGFVVGIPVRDEEERLPACLRALAQQRDRLGQPIPPTLIRIVVFANNCTDQSASLARKLGGVWSLNIRVCEAQLPPAAAHAGAARRAAMDIAEAWLVECGATDGVILTTDADSRVPKDWIANNLAAIDSGADAVLGRVALDEEGALLPEALHRRGALEDAYESLLTELSALLDPVDCNPWPHHSTISGASFAVRAGAYRRVGGLPRVPLGEDKALVAELRRADARIRFVSEIEVVTSARTNGRAPGGVADALRLRSVDPDALCDEALEPFHIAIKRAHWRGQLRRLRKRDELNGSGRWRSVLGISGEDAKRIAQAPTFGAAWCFVEATSPCLRRQALTPADLPGQIDGLQRAIAQLHNLSLRARQYVQPKRIEPAAVDDLEILTDRPDEEFDGLVPA